MLSITSCTPDKLAWPSRVLKRDHTTVPFNLEKISAILTKTYACTPPKDAFCGPAPATLQQLLINIHFRLTNRFNELKATTATADPAIDVEVVQDTIERALTVFAPHEVLRHFISTRNDRAAARALDAGYTLSKIPDDVPTPWGPLGFIVFKRTYARALPDGTSESFRQTILRVLDACRRQLHVPFTNTELHQAYADMLALKGSVAGRMLWQLGTSTVDRLGLLSLQNCAFVVIDEPIRPFTWLFDVLMLGCGVGVSVERKYITKLPPILMPRSAHDSTIKIVCENTTDADFIVPDKREGWTTLLEKLLLAFFYTGEGFTYSTHCIRNAGVPIKSFGGTASGPSVLVDGITHLTTLLNARLGKHLTSVDVLDIVCIIGSIVVAGNIRRSAILVIGDPDDTPYLNAKRWDTGTIPNWRANSNNSVACTDTTKLPDEFWDGYRGNGEPYGLVNIKLAQTAGRVSPENTDKAELADPNVRGFNPCAEQPLANYETCCLAEIFLPNITSETELYRVATTLYRICKHSLALKSHHYLTQRIVNTNMRMGIGITGVLQASPDQRAWARKLHDYLRAFDTEYSAKHGFPPSIKLTTIKPSGTLSLLAGVTSGIHPAYSQHLIRRIRIAADNPLVDLCKRNGYHTEPALAFDGTQDHSTSVVSFPCKFPENTTLAENMSAIQQLDLVREMQREYSDNAVSCTVYYRLAELDAIREWLAKHYTAEIKSCSFLLHSDHGFKQAPLEPITPETFADLTAKAIPIVDGHIPAAAIADASLECDGAHCPVK